jgi:replicative DNA helicase
MLFDLAWNKIEENRYSQINYIPFGFKRFEDYLPGILKKHYYIVTANAGVGKSQLTDYMFLYQAVNYYLQNKEKIRLKIFYFSLEMDKESKIIAGMSKRLYEKYQLRLSTNQILNFSKNRLPQHLYEALYKTKEYFDQFSEVVTIVDRDLNPNNIKNYVVEYAQRNGKIIKIDPNNPESEVYIPNHKNEFVLFITDHLAELACLPGKSLKETIEEHSDNCRKLRNKYGYTFIDVQQQMAAKEDQEFYQGLSIITKLEPSLHGLGESKLTQRKANVVLGLFAPNRFELKEYRNYNINLLQDNFRSLSILKYRNGISNVHVGLYFDGATNYFEELPPAHTLNADKYNEYRKKAGVI